MRQEKSIWIWLEPLILLGFRVSFNPINFIFLILLFFRVFRRFDIKRKNVSRVVKHFFYLWIGFFETLKGLWIFLKIGVRTLRADMFFGIFAIRETKKQGWRPCCDLLARSMRCYRKCLHQKRRRSKSWRTLLSTGWEPVAPSFYFSNKSECVPVRTSSNINTLSCFR